jgi:hypothetical protein
MTTPAEKLHAKLRKHLYRLCERHGVTGYEAAGVLLHLATEVTTASHVRDGLVQAGEDFDVGGAPEQPDATSPEPAPIPTIRVGQVWRRFDGESVEVTKTLNESTTGTILYVAGPSGGTPRLYLENGNLALSSKPRGSHPFDLAKLIYDDSACISPVPQKDVHEFHDGVYEICGVRESGKSNGSQLISDTPNQP